ncbi:hypothetical protein G9A89_020064 [Geosiphon pyriformis]|nr:hypothetical protein G9A89_020064 [Geosiphon pyriformis]
MTDFGLSNDYRVLDGLDQGSSQTVTQFILDVASEFFVINDISINNDKTVAISINQRIQNTVFRISGLPILIAKYDVPHRYLGIFLSIDNLSKSSLAKAQSNNAMIRKNFKLKAGLSWDFPNEVLYHPLLYNLKTFEQIQAETKSASVINFSNASGVVGQLFGHQFLDLQVFGWAPLNPLQFPVRLRVSPSNNFLAEIVYIFLNNNILLVNNLPNAFLNPGRYPVFGVLGPSLYYDQVVSLKRFSVAFCDRLLNKHALEETGFQRTCVFLVHLASSSDDPMVDVNNVLISSQFSNVKNSLLEVWSDSIFVFTDGSLKGLGSTDMAGGAMAFFLEIRLGIGVKIVGLLSSTMAELQAVALALECVSFSCSVEMERRHIANLVNQKNIFVVWSKVKDHFGVVDNDCADMLAGISAHSFLLLPTNVREYFMMANDMPISVHSIDWVRIVAVWHPDLGMLSGLTSRASVSLHSYFIKAVYGRLPVTVRKRLYSKNYPGILCLHCDKVEFSDHVFTCSKETVSHSEILFKWMAAWRSLSGSYLPVSLVVLESLLSCVHNVGLYVFFCKGFVLVGWFEEAVWIFENCKKAAQVLTNFMQNIKI